MLTQRLTTGLDGQEKAAELLRAGGLVALPTETVYGLAASAFDAAAVARIFAAKGRPQDNPLIVHIEDVARLQQVAACVPPVALRLAKAFWPGPLTLVLPRGERIPACVSAGLDTVAVRLPDNDVTRRIIARADLPLAAPSANRSGAPSPTTAQHVLDDLDGAIDAVVCAGACGVGVESTVVSLCTDPPRLLRPGAVTPEQLRAFLPDLVVDPAVLHQPDPGVRVASPGMKYRHYAPKTQLTLLRGDSAAFAAFVNRRADAAALCFRETLPLLARPAVDYGGRDDADEQAARLFDALRALDGLHAPRAYAEMPSQSGVGLAVCNRLLRAAGFRVRDLTEEAGAPAEAPNAPRVYGLTGPSGSGKSTFAALAAARGWVWIDCDRTVRELYATDPALCDALARAFGDEVRSKDGGIDRAALAKRAFFDAASTARLNELVLPAVRARIEREIAAGGAKRVLLDAPTLYESGLATRCRAVVAVLADEATRRARILSRDGLSEAQADARLSAGKPDAFYRARATYLLENNGDAAAFRAAAQTLLEQLEKGDDPNGRKKPV